MDNTVKIETKETETPSDAPFISVMVLNYSYGELLVRALEACAAQTFRDFEVVMINNGAIDNTEEIYQNFCAKYPEIRTTYVHIEQNQDLMHGWNAGLKAARGEYVMFNDSDDWMEPDCLECLAKKAKETGADRVTGQFRDVLPDGSIGRIHGCFGDLTVHSGWVQAVIFRRSIIIKNRLFYPDDDKHVYYYPDVFFTYAFVAKEEKRGEAVPRVIYNYCVHETSSSSKQYERKAKTYFEDAVGPEIVMTSEVIRSDIDDTVRNEIVYMTTKSTFAKIMKLEKYLPVSDWKGILRKTEICLNENLPGWDKNPLLRPFGNGYNLTESMGVYTVIKLDKLHAMWLMRLMCRVSDLFKYRR